MKKFFILISVLFIFLSPQLGFCDCGALTGANLLKICENGIKLADNKNTDQATPDDYYNSGACLGYIKGFIYMELAYSATLAIQDNPRPTPEDIEKRALFCLPEKMENKLYASIFIHYMKDHPEEMDKPACTALLDSFLNKFPCDDFF